MRGKLERRSERHAKVASSFSTSPLLAGTNRSRWPPCRWPSSAGLERPLTPDEHVHTPEAVPSEPNLLRFAYGWSEHLSVSDDLPLAPRACAAKPHEPCDLGAVLVTGSRVFKSCIPILTRASTLSIWGRRAVCSDAARAHLHGSVGTTGAPTATERHRREIRQAEWADWTGTGQQREEPGADAPKG